MNEFEALAETIRQLQAGQIAQARMLRAIISSHPNPAGLREAWRRFSSPSIAEASMSAISDPGRRAMHDALSLAMKDWDGRLERDLPAP